MGRSDAANGKIRSSKKINAPECRGFYPFLWMRRKIIYNAVWYIRPNLGPAAREGVAGSYVAPDHDIKRFSSSAPSSVQASAAANLSANGAQARRLPPRSRRAPKRALAARSRCSAIIASIHLQAGHRRIVLVGQSPRPERVIQVPSEQVLRAYERTARVERQLARQQSDQSSSSASSASRRRLNRPVSPAPAQLAPSQRRRSLRRRWLPLSAAPIMERCCKPSA